MGRARSITFWSVHLLWFAGLIWLAWALADLLDYNDYIEQWHLVLDHLDPWQPMQQFGRNAYGPLHNLFAPLILVHPLLPKMITCGTFAVAATVLLGKIVKRHGFEEPAMALWAVLIPINMNIVYMGFGSGANDLFVAALTLMAIFFRNEERFFWAGVFLGLGALLKLYPAIFVPFFMIAGNRIVFRPLVGFALTCAIGMGIAYLIWGDAVGGPFAFEQFRRMHFASLYTGFFYYPQYFPVDWLNWLVDHNSATMVAVGALAFLVVWLRGNSWLSSLLIGSTAVLLIYKVGHQQFFLPSLAIAAACLASDDANDMRVAWRFLPLALFLSFFEFFFMFAEALVPKWIGFVLFGAGLVSLLLMGSVRYKPGRFWPRLAW